MTLLADATPDGAAAALGAATPEVATAALRRYARQGGEAALSLLTGLLQGQVAPGVAAAALEALGEVRSTGAADLAARWAGETGAPPEAGTRETRKAARRALYRLAQAGVEPERRPPPPAPERERPERVRRAFMSAADGEGTRLLYLLLDPPLGGAHMARVIASETGGLMRFETSESTGRQFERFVTGRRPDRDFPLAEIPGPYARWLVAEAATRSRAAGRALPPSYLSFRDALLPPDDVPLPPIEDDPLYLEVRYRPDLAEQSVELLERPEFASWLPEPEAVTPLVAEWRTAGQGGLTLPPAVLAQRREAIRDRVVDLFTGPGGVPGARRRLEDNALVLLRQGETRAARQAVAAATQLDPDDPAAARAHPLFRAIAQRAIDAVVGPDDTPPAASEMAAPDAPPPEADDGLRRRPSGLILPR